MRVPQFIHSTTFHWALAVGGVLAIFVSMLFGFIYWKTDTYLIARSDRMTTGQLNILAAVPEDRRLYSINQHLKEDSRNVQYAGLFGADGRRIGGNLEQMPPELNLNDTVQAVSVVKELPAGAEKRRHPCNREASAGR